MRYRSKPSIIEAIQHTGDFAALQEFAGQKVDLDEIGQLILWAGKDGAQEWVPVPLNHWLVHQPDDLSDIWPVDPDYFATKYEVDA